MYIEPSTCLNMHNSHVFGDLKLGLSTWHPKKPPPSIKSKKAPIRKKRPTCRKESP